MPDQMQFYDAVEHAAKSAGMTLAQVGREAGRTGAYITSARARGSLPKVDNAAAIMEACGWRLVAVPCDSVPADGLVISPSHRGEDQQRAALERRRERLRRELAETEQLLG